MPIGLAHPTVTGTILPIGTIIGVFASSKLDMPESKTVMFWSVLFKFTTSSGLPVKMMMVLFFWISTIQKRIKMAVFKKPTMIRINASQANNYIQPIMQYIKYKDGDFEIGKYQVTFGEYDLFCEDTKKELIDDNKWRGRQPVINVNWHDAVAYCEWLSQKSGQNYRLPTETEWEYACRAGTDTKWSFGDDENELEKYAWYDKNSDNKTHPVGEKLPNPWGLYDMHGNVWEWCEDDWSENYNETPRDGSAYRDKKSERKVIRGGSWFNFANRSRSSIRYRFDPANRDNDWGFRLLRTLPF